MTTLTLDVSRTTEAILFLSTKISELNCSWLAELCYQADRLSLTMYGRVITGASYSLEGGKIASDELLSLVEGREDINAMMGTISNHRALNEDNLSRSDMDCLTTVSSVFLDSLHYTGYSELDYSETYPNTAQGELISLKAIAETIPNNEALLQHLFEEKSVLPPA